MASKLFLDANLLLDFTLKRKDYPFAEALIQQGVDDEADLFTTPAVVHITSYWTRKARGSQVTKTVLVSLLNDAVTVIDCDHATTMAALYSHMTDVEDALQYFTALKYTLDYFISSDQGLKKAALPQLPVISAEDSLKMTNAMK